MILIINNIIYLSDLSHCLCRIRNITCSKIDSIMKPEIIALAIVLAITSSGCGNRTDETEHNHSAVSEHENHSHAETGDQNIVSLNNGEKWEANIETSDGMNNMINLIKNFPADTTSDNCRITKEKLNVEYASIIEKCTMTGEAHNQLHKFLVPLNNYINELDGGDIENCRKNLERINDHLAEYYVYFH